MKRAVVVGLLLIIVAAGTLAMLAAFDTGDRRILDGASLEALEPPSWGWLGGYATCP